jgi:nucleotide-binding universal stress UspA family protein
LPLLLQSWLKSASYNAVSSPFIQTRVDASQRDLSAISYAFPAGCPEMVMSFKQILVPLNGSERDEIALGTAFAIAKESNAHIAALFVRPDARFATPTIGFSLLPDVIAQIAKSAKRVADEAARTTHRRFTTAAINAKVSIVDRPKNSLEVTASFHEADGFAFECVSQAAKFADLVVYGPLDEPEDFLTSAGFTEVLMTARRPVLLSPTQLTRTPRKVAIGWDGGHATARSVCAALPLLIAADEVEVIMVKRAARDPGFDDLRDYLAVSDVHFTRRIVEKGTRSVGEELMDAAHSGGADLLVMGAYGHSPLREAIVGGPTAYALVETSLPIFLVH